MVCRGVLLTDCGAPLTGADVCVRDFFFFTDINEEDKENESIDQSDKMVHFNLQPTFYETKQRKPRCKSGKAKT
jgi:hypothetical protein